MSEKSEILYKLMIHKGYPEEFSRLICQEMSTEYTAERMTNYIAASKRLSLEDVADEMLAIKDFRDTLVQKHISEHAQERINDLYNNINEGQDED